MNEQHELFDHLVSVKCLNLLFTNFKSSDVERLKQNEDFTYLWDKYLTGLSGFATYGAFWELWSRADPDTQLLILDHARQRYQLEAEESFRSAFSMRQLEDSIQNKHQ